MAKVKQLSTRQVIENAEQIFHSIRWKNGIVVCPYCGSIHVKEYDGYKYKCNHCKTRFNDKTKTLLHGSKLSVKVWMQGIYEMFVDNFVSSITLSKKLGINQKSAWLLQTKLRYAMPQDRWLLNGVIAQDEMYVGGSLSNFHYSRKLDLLRRNNLLDKGDTHYDKKAIFILNSTLKQPVFAMNDGNNIVMYATPNPIKKEYIRKIFNKHVTGKSVAVSDESQLYIDFEKATGSKIYTNNHHNNQYQTENGLTSNAIENTFSWFKRGFNGRITHCKYHQFYLNEFAFRYNTRELSTQERFDLSVGNTIGMVVRYKDIREYNSFSWFKSKAQVNRESSADKKRIKTIKTMFEMGLTSADGTIRYKGRIYTAEDFK